MFQADRPAVDGQGSLSGKAPNFRTGSHVALLTITPLPTWAINVRLVGSVNGLAILFKYLNDLTL